ncbi:MAG: NADPH-dependent 7-cyano-7-deazaguanine reductase QueF [Rubrivivax sp.]|nr:NADPH-dependent 7-cyano-7-deazaguanine reductase QueF [Rubrivivax sp.]
MKEYNEDTAKKGIKAKLPKIKCWPNQYRNYEIKITIPEFTSVCPKTSLPDFGKIEIRYMPDKFCIELKSLKYYILGYRNLGIFYENAVNKILNDIKEASKPKWVVVEGKFNSRGGMITEVLASYGKIPPTRD